MANDRIDVFQYVWSIQKVNPGMSGAHRLGPFKKPVLLIGVMWSDERNMKDHGGYGGSERSGKRVMQLTQGERVLHAPNTRLQ